MYIVPRGTFDVIVFTVFGRWAKKVRIWLGGNKFDFRAAVKVVESEIFARYDVYYPVMVFPRLILF
jgi:hypothetical protein